MNFKNPMPEKKSFNFYYSWSDLLRKIDAESVKELILALVDYAETGSLPDFSENLVCDLIFTQMSKQVEADTKKYIITSLRNSLNATMRWNKDNDLGYKGMEEFHCSKEEREEKFKAIAKQMMMGTYATASDRMESNADIDVDVDVDVETEEDVVVGEEADPESVPHSGQHDNSQQHIKSPSKQHDNNLPTTEADQNAIHPFQFTDAIPPIRSQIEGWFKERVLYRMDDPSEKASMKTDRFYKMHEKYDWYYVRKDGLLNKLEEFIRDDKYDKQMYTDYKNWTPDANRPKKTERNKRETLDDYRLEQIHSFSELRSFYFSNRWNWVDDITDLIREYYEMKGLTYRGDETAFGYIRQYFGSDADFSYIRNELLDYLHPDWGTSNDGDKALSENDTDDNQEYMTDDGYPSLPFS